MTQADWVKEFEQRWFVKNGELSVETYMEIQDFISKVESLAQQRTEKKWLGEDKDGAVLWKYKGVWHRGLMDVESGECSDDYVDSHPNHIKIVSDLLEE